MQGDIIVEPTITAALSSTKNKEHKRDEEIHQTKRGTQWYFEMKVHSGVDAGNGYVHTITVTSVNVHDVSEAEKLIREDDEVMYGDSGYLNIEDHLDSMSTSQKSAIELRCLRSIKKSTGTKTSKTGNRQPVAKQS